MTQGGAVCGGLQEAQQGGSKLDSWHHFKEFQRCDFKLSLQFFFVDRPPLLVVKQGSHKLGGRHSRRKQRRASEALFGK